MKLRDIDPCVTGWSRGTFRKVSTWHYVDTVADDGSVPVREVWHYSTLMGYFVRINGWEFRPVSVGWGSVSDQNGMNQITRGYGYRFVRKGGARYVAMSNTSGGY